MTHAVADQHFDAVLPPKLRIGLPLVSVIIVNHNYRHFLAEAIDSVLAQTYPHVELIVVDDASTDGSHAVLDAVEQAHPQVVIIRRAQNGGQSLATQQGFAACSGDYIVFVDSDDVLLPDFVATHIYVHLSLRIPVGLTSSDMAQAAGSRVVLSTVQHFSDYVRTEKKSRCDLIRRVEDNGRDLWPLPIPELAERIHFVPPEYKCRWVWAPTSGNCFRRDAVEMFIKNEAFGSLRTGTDAYFVRGVASLTGSVLIDRALSIYRMHGANVFAQHPNLNGLLNYDRTAASENDQKGRLMVVDYLIAHADFFARKVHSPYYFLRALWTLNGSWPRLPSRIPGCHTYVGGEVIDHFQPLSQVIRRWQLALLAICLGVTPWTLFIAWIKSFRQGQS